MKINTDEQTKDLITKVKDYIADDDGWKLVKKGRGVNIFSRPSSEFDGHVFKAVGVVDASPEQCYKYVDPKPEGKRCKWDKAIKGLEIIEYLKKDDPEVFILRTMTHSAAMGFISPRDFVDLVINQNTDEFVGTFAHSIHTDQCPPDVEGYVRGTNFYCGILCYRINGEPNKTKMHYIAQSEIGGMIPRSVVSSTLPSTVMDFYINIRKQIEDEGCTEYSF